MADGLALNSLGKIYTASGQNSKTTGKNGMRSLLVWESLEPADGRTAALTNASKETGHLSRSIASKHSLLSHLFPFFFFFSF